MRRVLHISPVLPHRRGNGLEQRAFRLIEALASRYRVSLVAAARADRPATAAPDTRALCDDITVLPFRRWTPGAAARRALRRFVPAVHHAWTRDPSDWFAPTRADRALVAAAYRRRRFDLIHVHRLYMMPLLRSCGTSPDVPVSMDLDDIESMTRDRLADLARRNGDLRLARQMTRDAEAYRAIERRDLARFDRIFVCSDADRDRLRADEGPANVEVLPNVVEVPDERCAPAPHRAPGAFRFLFVGTLDYYPNFDAMSFFCREVAPLIRRRASRRFEIRIASNAGLARRRQVPTIPEMSWAPLDADLAREYGAADVAIVPIRAGGGTRIKVLEAFAHRTAVVATSIGVEGLDVEHDTHALIGRSAAELAEHALAAMEDAGLRDRLARRALALVQSAYTPDVLRRRLGAAIGGPLCA